MSNQLKPGLTLDIQTRSYGGGMGETFYIICDEVGLVFQTIFPEQLARFYVGGCRVSGITNSWP